MKEKMKRFYFETTRYFGYNVYSGKISLDETVMYLKNVLENIVQISSKTRTKKKIRKKILLIV